jgi:glycosyltransferase involved in cell wall biosynthesis
MAKPRVMLVGPWPPATGGVTTFMVNVVGSDLRQRFDFLHFSTSRPPKQDVTDNYGYGSILRGGIRRILSGALITLWHLVAFPFAVLVHRPDIVQVQSSDFQSFWESALYVLMSRRIGRPVFMRLGGSFDYFYEVSSPGARRLIRRILHLPDQLIVQSSYWRDLIIRLGRTENIVILPNWIDDRKVIPAARTDGIPVCLFIAGTEAVRKGVDDVVGAMHLLKKSKTRLRVRLIAATPQLRARLIQEGLDDMADVEGYIGHNELLAVMREVDIFLLPSRGEGFPNSLIEAMASGAACVVTAVGAVPEIVGTDGAIVVPMRDAAALARAIQQLVGNPAHRQSLRERGCAIVRAHYVASVVLAVLENAWLAALRRASISKDDAAGPQPSKVKEWR